MKSLTKEIPNKLQIPWRTSKGFTLIEVMVALVLLVLTMATLMELFSINLRSSKKVSDYTEAIILAKSEIEKSLYGDLEVSTEIEELGPYTITREIKLIEDETDISKTYEIAVRISWANNSFELKTIRTVGETEQDEQ